MGKHSKRSRFRPQVGVGSLWRPALCTALVTSGVVLVSSSVFPKHTDEFQPIGPDPYPNPFSDAETVLLPQVPETGPVEATAAPVGTDAPTLTSPADTVLAAADAARAWRPTPRPTTSPPSTTKSEPTTRATPSTPPKQPQSIPPVSTPSANECGQTGWGLKPRAAQLANHIKSRFPLVLSILGYRASARDPAGHPSGLAVDFMVPVGGILGDSIAQYLLDHKATLHVDYVIWKQRINYGSGWKPMENRGSITENHYDHVHVNVVAGSADLTGC